MRVQQNEGLATTTAERGSILAVGFHGALADIRATLLLSGYAVHEATDQADAWRALAAQPADLVLLHLSGSAVEALAFCRGLQTLPAHDRPPVITIGDEDAQLTHLEAFRSGAAQHIRVPCPPDDLLTPIESVLRLGAGRRKAESSLAFAQHELSLQRRLAQLLLQAPSQGLFVGVLDTILNELNCQDGLFAHVGRNGDLIGRSVAGVLSGAGAKTPEGRQILRSAWEDSICGVSVRERRTVQGDASTPLPGNIGPAEACLATPIVNDEKVLGCILVANRPGGFTAAHVEILEMVAAHLAPVLEATLLREREEGERQKAQRASDEALRRLGMAVEAGRLGTWEYWPLTGAIDSDAHARALIGAPPDGPLTHDMIWPRIHPGDQALADAIVARGIAKGSTILPEVELRVLGENGATRCLAVRGELSHVGKQPRVLGVVLDISERKAADAALIAREEDLRRKGEQLQQALVTAVDALASTLEKRDPYTAGHSRRVATMAVALAREVGLDESRIEGLMLAASVHDVGKIQVPSEILSKPTRLTAAEYELIKAHPGAGYDILKGIAFPWPVADMVHQHHELLDGTGYPLGLKGDQILLESRILTVADIVEAMSSHRPYRPARGMEAALAEVENLGAQGKLDAKVVAACLKLYRPRPATLPAEAAQG